LLVATVSQPGQWSGPDPVPAFKFWVEIDSIVVAEFRECSGLNLEREVQEILEGGLNERVHYLPGRAKGTNIVLKYGLLYSRELWDWYQTGLYDGKVTRVNFSILLRDVQGEVVQRWDFLKGFPVKWEGPALNVESSQAAVETLEIAHLVGGGGGGGAGGGDAGGGGEKKEEKQKVDVQALAGKLYQYLKDEARVEYERLGRHQAW
jgi:phage tail-like protein